MKLECHSVHDDDEMKMRAADFANIECAVS